MPGAVVATKISSENETKPGIPPMGVHSKKDKISGKLHKLVSAMRMPVGTGTRCCDKVGEDCPSLGSAEMAH